MSRRQAKTVVIPVSKDGNVTLRVHLGGHLDALGGVYAPPGLGVHVRVADILGPSVELRPHSTAAITYGLTKREALRLLRRAVRLLEGK